MKTSWYSSSWCDSNLCLQVRAGWAKSSRCSDGECLEVRAPVPTEVCVRDSADKDGPVLTFTPGDWRSFLAFVGR